MKKAVPLSSLMDSKRQRKLPIGNQQFFFKLHYEKSWITTRKQIGLLREIKKCQFSILFVRGMNYQMCPPVCAFLHLR
jgi:hypothetical protein